jgi:hypothetical protein
VVFSSRKRSRKSKKSAQAETFRFGNLKSAKLILADHRNAGGLAWDWAMAVYERERNRPGAALVAIDDYLRQKSAT